MSKLGIEAFATRDRANQGVKLPLCTPEGDDTEHWLMIKGIDSDDFQKAIVTRSEQSTNVDEIKDAHERITAIKRDNCEMLASIVSDWSFSDKNLMPEGKAQKCTPKNVVAFLESAPQVRDQIDNLISDRERYFTEQRKSS